MTKTTIAAMVCDKCGATVFPAAKFCGACVLEMGLGPFEDENDSALDRTASRMLMDFGDYELLDEIGRGGQGVVYRARQKSLNRVVALKVIGLGHWATEAHLKRFRLEAEAAASLDHPGIVPIYEIGEREGSCYFSMKFVEGGHLDEVVRRAPLSLRAAAELVVKVARTVHHAHEHGVLHRDIKPGNILLDERGEPHLTDFGLARLVEKDSTITHTLDVLGTPSYMAPEQAAGQIKELTTAADVYGLGAVLYQLLTSHPPFAGGTTYETIRLVLETEPRPPRLWNPKVDRDLSTICLKYLEKDPAKRYGSALELAEDLERWLRHEPVRARRSGLITRGRKWVRRHPAAAVLAPSLAVVATLAGIMIWNDWRDMPTTGIAVLPFENLSDDKENAFFADGMQDDILTKLAKVAGLKVISRTSVMQYRGERNARQIGNALRVSHVLEGSVRKSNGRIRLNAQLIDTRTNGHVWAEQYEGEMSELFAIENAVAQNIVRQLHSTISVTEKSAMETKPTQNLEAYDLYLRSRALMQSTSSMESDSWEKFSKAANLLDQAVARDPKFALAWCLLAEAHLNRYWRPQQVPNALENAEAAVKTARRLAPEAGEIHLAEAMFYYLGQRDYDRALEALEKASRSLPNSAEALRLSGQIERRLGRWKESFRHTLKASELDPRNWVGRDSLITTYLVTRHHAEAHQLAERMVTEFPEKADYFRTRKVWASLAAGNLPQARIELAALQIDSDTKALVWMVPFYERNYSEAYRVLALAEPFDRPGARFSTAFQKGLTARAAGDLETARSAFLAARKHYLVVLNKAPENKIDSDATEVEEMQPDQGAYYPEMLSQLAIADAGLGRKEEALREARRAIELRPISRDAVEGPEVAANLAVVYSLIGERERAIEQLSSLAKVPNGLAHADLKLNPAWDDLRDDPRFAQIVAEAAQAIPLK